MLKFFKSLGVLFQNTFSSSKSTNKTAMHSANKADFIVPNASSKIASLREAYEAKQTGVVKVAIVGTQGSGKTALIQRFSEKNFKRTNPIRSIVENVWNVPIRTSDDNLSQFWHIPTYTVKNNSCKNQLIETRAVIITASLKDLADKDYLSKNKTYFENLKTNLKEIPTYKKTYLCLTRADEIKLENKAIDENIRGLQNQFDIAKEDVTRVSLISGKGVEAFYQKFDKDYLALANRDKPLFGIIEKDPAAAEPVIGPSTNKSASPVSEAASPVFRSIPDNHL